MEKIRLAFALGIILLSCSSSHAQSGCFHSPEAPTDVLVLVGGAGMFYGSAVLRKWIRRRR